jgi:hypothetical protein
MYDFDFAIAMSALIAIFSTTIIAILFVACLFT